LRWTLAGLVGTLTLSFALIGCSGSAAPQIDYVVDGTLVSYNTNTVVGAASAGAQAFARTLTGFGYHGPDGQVVADRDFGTVSVVGGAPLVLDYQIADNAVYSDGKPVTADDVLKAARNVDRQLIEQTSLFDVYEGKGVPEGKKSLAIAVRLQPKDKTLTDAEIEAVAAKIVAAVTKATGASLRS